MTFARPTRSALIDRARSDVNARVPGADSRLRRSVLSAIAAAHAGGLDGAYGYLDYIANQVMPDTADSEHLARWASFWGVTPKTATAATGSAVSAESANGRLVPAGTTLQRADGYTYITSADAEVTAGVATVAVEASDAGSAGSALAGVMLDLVSPIAGVSGPFTVVADMSGADPEKDPELLSRLLARIQSPPTGGGPGDYEAWALQVPGVTRAWEYPLRMGLGTVGVAFVFDDRTGSIIPTGGDVTAMQAWLDSLAPVTAAVTAFAPTSLVVDFTISVTPNTSAVQAAVAAELAAWFEREANPESTLLKSHYDQAIEEAAGVTDHLVISPSGDIVPTGGQLPMLGTITWIG